MINIIRIQQLPRKAKRNNKQKSSRGVLKALQGRRSKLLIEPLSKETFEYTDEIVLEALNKLDLNKATSCDLLPGNSFRIFKKSSGFIARKFIENWNRW